MCLCLDFTNQICIVKFCKFRIKLNSVSRVLMLNALKSPHKIKVPESSSELAVCDHMISGFFLLLYQIKNCIILNLCQFFFRNFSFFKISPCFFQCIRSYKASYIVITKWCIFTHNIALLFSFVLSVFYVWKYSRVFCIWKIQKKCSLP